MIDNHVKSHNMSWMQYYGHPSEKQFLATKRYAAA